MRESGAAMAADASNAAGVGSAGYGSCNLVMFLSACALIFELTISGNTLMWLGIPYMTEGGEWIEKIHPGTYCSVLALMARLLQGGNPLRNGRRILWKAPELGLFLAAIFLCVAYAALATGPGGLITLIDTFLPAGMLAAALVEASPSARGMLNRLLSTLFLLNAVVALIESVAREHVIPIAGNVPELASEFRPTGLFDHPLTAAMSTMMGIFLHLGRRGFRGRVPIYEAVLILSLFAFGGRIAILLTIAGCAYLCLPGLWRATLRHDVAPRAWISVCLAAVGVATAAVGAGATGISDRLLAHLYWDPSAQARIYQFDVLNHMDGLQLVFGARRMDLLALIEPLRLQYGADVIENFWLLMFCTLGALCFPVFVIGLLSLVRFMLRSANAYTRVMILSVMLAASCSNSLGRKSTLLVTLVGCVAASDQAGRGRYSGRYRFSRQIAGYGAIA